VGAARQGFTVGLSTDGFTALAGGPGDSSFTGAAWVFAATTINSQFAVQDKWNIVSVPLTMGDYTKTVLFPTAATDAYTFDGGYVSYDTLENGKGYWLKYTSGGMISHDGLVSTEDTIDVAEGWNMVGSLSSSISIANVSSIPGGIVTSDFYAYDGAYTRSSTLEPGKGYWVKAGQSGQLVMSSIVVQTPENRIRIQDTHELPPPPPGGLSSLIPGLYSLDQNYPNPFNPTTTIRYTLPAASHVKLSVFNILGEAVLTLVDERQEAGVKTVSLNAGDLPSGVYTYRIRAGAFTDVKRMLLLK